MSNKSFASWGSIIVHKLPQRHASSIFSDPSVEGSFFNSLHLEGDFSDALRYIGTHAPLIYSPPVLCTISLCLPDSDSACTYICAFYSNSSTASGGDVAWLGSETRWYNSFDSTVSPRSRFYNIHRAAHQDHETDR